MNIVKKLWSGPYSLPGYLAVVSLGAGLITAVAVYLEGWLLYASFETVPGVTHISESFFTPLLATLITGIILQWHATKGGQCLTLKTLGRCPFLFLLILGLVLGAISVGLVFVLQGSGDIAYETLIKTKVAQGLMIGLSLPLLFHLMGLLRHPDINYDN